MSKTNSFLINNSSLEEMLNWAKKRIVSGPDPISGAKKKEFLDKELGNTITKKGIGWKKTFDLFSQTFFVLFLTFEELFKKIISFLRLLKFTIFNF